MAILWINLIFVYMSSLLARYCSKLTTFGLPNAKPNKLLIYISMTLLILVAGLRNNIGDTSAYMFSYVNGNLGLGNIRFEGEFGFSIYQTLLHEISANPQLLIFTSALITNALIVLTFYKYSRMIELSLFVYITGGGYTVSMNGIRQFLASSIIFFSLKYLMNGDWKKYFLMVLLASTIHNSALILIPIYFIVRRKAWTKATFLLLFLGVLIVMCYNQFIGVLFSVIGDTRYGDYAGSTAQGANVVRLAVISLPSIIAFLGREKLRRLWPESDYIVNLTLLNTIFMLIATQNWIFARFGIYFGLYNLILISYIVELFKKRDRKLIYYILLSCYIVYFYYDQVITLEIVYRSNYINL